MAPVHAHSRILLDGAARPFRSVPATFLHVACRGGSCPIGGDQRELTLERILFGDNQFFGINHFSEEKARQQAMKFQDVVAIVDVLQSALSAGVSGFMCTTHDTVGQIADEVRAHAERWGGFRFYPGMPYAHKYANAVTELGYMGALKKFTPSGGMVEALTRGTRAVLGKDIQSVMSMPRRLGCVGLTGKAEAILIHRPCRCATTRTSRETSARS